ncbi:hypothetical protein AQUCO_01000403v1 [Aquilegia coerulea]|uniref:Protein DETOXIFICATION n=1 Tax=Aquilegia coerulea TaxID=218851 RepID=A0A2G5E9T5_AQUCA|nr:hypothetical protein AQUCO_01000403v1 [Aquilegia coerulea]
MAENRKDNDLDNSKGALELKRSKKLAAKGCSETITMWHIAGPAILTGLAQFSIGFVTTAFIGHVGEAELAALSVVQNVIEGFSYGLGMGSALETLCGQAVGAGQFNMLGIYMQRSWIITGITALILTPTYIFASPILNLLRQSNHVSEFAGRYSVWVIPQLFAYAFNFPIQKFLQSQSKVWVMTIISIVVLLFHVLLCWVLVIRLGHGLLGAAIAGNISWSVVVVAQMVYIVSGCFPNAWTGFSLLAFQSLVGFVKLSLSSALMLCLDFWYFTALILLVGYLKNPEIAVDAVSICLNLQVWALTIAMGFSAAVSVRVSNELGAGQPKVAKFSIVVAVSASALVGIIFMAIIMASKPHFPEMFTNRPLVIKETSKLGYLLAATVLLNSIQPILNGVAVGAGWQSLVAFVNVGCYYFFGLPISILLGYKFKFGVLGIWSGILSGCLLQTVILLFITIRTNWHKEALQAEERVKTWGGPSEHEPPKNQS